MTILPGTKGDKSRVTIYVVAAMDGHMEKMWLINSSLKPRAFKRINNDFNRLPACIEWRASKKGG